MPLGNQKISEILLNPSEIFRRCSYIVGHCALKVSEGNALLNRNGTLMNIMNWPGL
jgi:hypothetical protein